VTFVLFSYVESSCSSSLTVGFSLDINACVKVWPTLPVSLPAPPSRKSLPGPPKSWSLPSSPPRIVSLPSSPQIRSSPPSPFTKSSPSRPAITSLPSVPTMLLSPDVPTMVAGSPSQVIATVIVNDALPSLPAASTAVHVTVVVPIGNVEPDTGVHEIVMSPPTLSCVIVPSSANVTVPSTLSVADTVYLTWAPYTLVGSTTMSSGTVMTGSMVSSSGGVGVGAGGGGSSSMTSMSMGMPIGTATLAWLWS
jgi:hypothetical protein